MPCHSFRYNEPMRKVPPAAGVCGAAMVIMLLELETFFIGVCVRSRLWYFIGSVEDPLVVVLPLLGDIEPDNECKLGS